MRWALSVVRCAKSSPTPNAKRTTHRALRLLFIDAVEVVADRPALVGGQTAQLVPVRLAELRRALSCRICIRRRELFVPLRRPRFALVAVLALVLLERAAGIKDASEELLLSGERRTVDASSLERVGDLTRFLCQLCGAIAAGAFSHLVELLGDAPLLPRQRARCRLHLRGHLPARHRHETLSLRVDRALLLGHLL